MYQSQINVRYAKSLFQLAIEKDIVDEVRQDIELLLDTINTSEDFNDFLDRPVIKASKKMKVLSELFEGEVNKYTISFLNLIVKNKREQHIKSICINFIDLYTKHKGIKKAVLTTAYVLSRTQEQKVQKAIEKSFKSDIDLDTKVDESIIGGMIIQVEDKLLDLSVVKQIQNVRRDFYKIDFNSTKKSK